MQTPDTWHLLVISVFFFLQSKLNCPYFFLMASVGLSKYLWPNMQKES
jgi:hypothetical protein